MYHGERRSAACAGERGELLRHRERSPVRRTDESGLPHSAAPHAQLPDAEVDELPFHLTAYCGATERP